MESTGGFEHRDPQLPIGRPGVAPLPVSQGHTPIYKQHRYFARRPHNQFRAILEHLTAPGSVILDCFAGGGVTLVEGLTLDRRVISIDVNPIASMVQLGQAVDPDFERVAKVIHSVVEALPADIDAWYQAQCHACGSSADVRWFEHAYTVDCPRCSGTTTLRNAARARRADGSQVAGRYNCDECGHDFRSVDTLRTGSRVLSVRLRCRGCGIHETRPADDADQNLIDNIGNQEASLAAAYDIDVPHVAIPLDWDRQAEDALHRKGFTRFSDLFTPRNRLSLAFLLRELRVRRPDLAEDEYVAALLVLSSLVRYVNNMTISTSQWMDGRPVAWAKHAYWTPNQFVECNPFEYLQHRLAAAQQAQTDRRTRFANKRHSNDPLDVLTGEADFAVVNGDARQIALPDRSIDAIVTDPPFGSNVQYGELTELWSVWLGDLNPFASPDDNIASEILVHRKKRPGRKTVDDYQAGLTDVFAECFRVLRDPGVLVFTFNNKDPLAWCAVMGAAFAAGFGLHDDDIGYQSEITAYRDTAHLRFDRELQGDVVYTFRKGRPTSIASPSPLSSWITDAQTRVASRTNTARWQAERVAIHLDAIAQAARAFQLGRHEEAQQWLVEGRRLTSDEKRPR